MYSVSQTAIRRWDARGLIRCHRTPGNHRRITLFEIDRLLGVLHRETDMHPVTRRCAIYARVSGHRQKTDGDLDRQLKNLTRECRNRFKASPLVFTDIGSGLNMGRRGLQRLLQTARNGAIHTVLITHRDRLARFGVDLVERLLADYGATVTAIHEREAQTPHEQLVADLMTIIASFSGRVYGLRAAAMRESA